MRDKSHHVTLISFVGMRLGVRLVSVAIFSSFIHLAREPLAISLALSPRAPHCLDNTLHTLHALCRAILSPNFLWSVSYLQSQFLPCGTSVLLNRAQSANYPPQFLLSTVLPNAESLIRRASSLLTSPSRGLYPHAYTHPPHDSSRACMVLVAQPRNWISGR